MAGLPGSRDLDIEIELQPKELEFLDAVDAAPAGGVIGYGGAKGGGKSHGLRNVQVERRLRFPGTTGLIFRRTFDDLWQNHISKFLEEFPDLAPFYSVQHKTAFMPGGGRILFRAGDTKKDILAFRGKEYGDVGIDEATELDEEDLKILFTSCRSPTSYQPKKILTFNPGGVGHGWAKRIFVDRELTDQERKTTYSFVQAYAWDNAFWCVRALEQAGISKDEYFGWTETKRRDFFLEHGDYAQELLGLPEALREAWLWGKWDVFAGQYFHPPFPTFGDGDFDFPPHLPSWIALDWGYDHDSAVHWFRADENAIYTTREYVQNAQTPTELANAIVDLNAGFPQGHVYLSPDAFGKRTSPRTIATEIGDVFAAAGLPRPLQADTDRIGGWSLMNQLMRNEQWWIHRSCTKLLRVLPTLIYDTEHKEGDVEKVDGDDPADSARYGVKSQKHVVYQPRRVRVAARAAREIEPGIDLTSKRIHMERILAEETRGGLEGLHFSGRANRARMARRKR